jgi:hypothetical protein
MSRVQKWDPKGWEGAERLSVEIFPLSENPDLRDAINS